MRPQGRGSIISTATVPAIYISAINAPEAKIARGNVRCGSFTSSLMAETSSSPANAKASCGQKFTVSQFQCGTIAAHVKCVTDPCRNYSSSATPTIIISGIIQCGQHRAPFGFFGGTSLIGYRSGALRAEEAVTSKFAYGYVIGSVFRIERRCQSFRVKTFAPARVEITLARDRFKA